MNDHDMRRVNEVLGVVAGALSIVIAVRLLVGPDTMTTARMGVYRGLSRNAKRGADLLTQVAANADTAYHRLSNVTA